MPRTTFLLMTHAQQTETVFTACLQLTFLTERSRFKVGVVRIYTNYGLLHCIEACIVGVDQLMEQGVK